MIVFLEGPNEVGKTTLAHALETELERRGQQSEVVAFPGNRSGSLGWLVKRLHEDPADLGVDESIHPASIQMLHVAAHVDSIQNRIRPLLDEGTTVILDRFWWSTLIYGRVSGVSDEVLRAMIQVEELFWDDLQPDVAFLIDRDTPYGSKVDLGIWERLRTEYRELAEEQSARHPVEIIENDSSIDHAIEEILSRIGPMF